ncbi:trimethylamine methyltransferase family protein [Leisingera sp. NJS204]|uniref:trimethylamine methyltransferase family protein n=1 Tax=Leisingera sp. NJS204 TaxID=2508307 RepID=UPI0020C7E882|nr:trimethylamine methyltransferase family protein [Leisingera sp. NJS204]
MEAAVLAGFPVQLISAGQAGATSPATIAGSLVQGRLWRKPWPGWCLPGSSTRMPPRLWCKAADFRPAHRVNVRRRRRTGDPDGSRRADGAVL